MTRITLLSLPVVVVIAALQPARPPQPLSETAEVRKCVDKLEGDQRQVQVQLELIRKELDQVLSLLRARPLADEGGAASAVPSEPIAVQGGASMGDLHAPLVLIEFADFQCPYCARHARNTLPPLERDFIRTGRVRYVFHNFPLEGSHPWAMMTAIAGTCAGEQGRFWDMHKCLFEDQRVTGPEDLIARAVRIGLDRERFAACLAGDTIRHVRAEVADARRAGVTSTPTFYLGIPTDEGHVRIVRRIAGAKPYPEFQAILDGRTPPSAAKY